eukprot:510803-Karenia_brevis.AAC.1
MSQRCAAALDVGIASPDAAGADGDYVQSTAISISVARMLGTWMSLVQAALLTCRLFGARMAGHMLMLRASS